ncbi:MAG: hypothetical protein IIC21_02160 [Chloroflexi bacterium]|nr:hypothetical protein [Chloroflexota bacterium]
MEDPGDIERQFGSELRLFCRRMVYNDAVAEEVVQDVLVAACKTPTAEVTHLRGWLYRVARNRCLDVLRKMKPTALFINNGRGPTVDESALIKALQEGWIAAAGLDVLEQEPPDPDNPLLSMENVTLTPHVASASERMRPETRRRVGQEIALVLTGRWPRTCVNPSVLDKTDLQRWQPYSMGRGPGA